jgi:hypothetical protein
MNATTMSISILDNGNIVLSAEGVSSSSHVLFRVHKFTLAKTSVVFCDMFMPPQRLQTAKEIQRILKNVTGRISTVSQGIWLG